MKKIKTRRRKRKVARLKRQVKKLLKGEEIGKEEGMKGRREENLETSGFKS